MAAPSVLDNGKTVVCLEALCYGASGGTCLVRDACGDTPDWGWQLGSPNKDVGVVASPWFGPRVTEQKAVSHAAE